MYNSPLQSMVQDGEEILRNLDETSRNLEMAIEHKFATGRRLGEIEATYKDLESEYLVEQLYRDQPASPVKLLAADKELIRDAELVKARTSGSSHRLGTCSIAHAPSTAMHRWHLSRWKPASVPPDSPANCAPQSCSPLPKAKG